MWVGAKSGRNERNENLETDLDSYREEFWYHSHNQSFHILFTTIERCLNARNTYVTNKTVSTEEDSLWEHRKDSHSFLQQLKRCGQRVS